MRGISFSKLLKRSLISFSILLFFLMIFISVRYSLHIDLIGFILESFCFIFALALISLCLDLKNRWINWGLILIGTSFFSDVLDEIKFIFISSEGFRNLYFIFEKTTLITGLLIVSYGVHTLVVQQKSLVNDLKSLVLNDPLTDIPNRSFIAEKLSSFISQSHFHPPLIAVFFIDLDNFKLVNDTFGHSFGDALLQKTANKLKSCIDEKCILGRISGDEFMIIFHDVYSVNAIENLAKRIISEFKIPLFTQAAPIHITCSIGISMFPNDGYTVDALIKNADLAMYRAKEKGKNNYSFYDNTMGTLITEKFKVAEDLRAALRRNEFVLHYQPKVSIQNNKITGFEALIRWNHPEVGFLYPDKFIAIAEETGLIKNIDEHVLELACLQIREWISKGFDPLNISVNICAELFNERNFINRVDAILARTQVDPSCLSIEITETLAIKDIEHTHKTLAYLQNKGIKILLDDFGKGHSSLGYLKSLPIDTLKIDRMFINGISENAKDEALIKAIITMCKALQIKVVAEGVEETHQLKFLDKLGCHEYQGYLFSKPRSTDEIEKVFLSVSYTY